MSAVKGWQRVEWAPHSSASPGLSSPAAPSSIWSTSGPPARAARHARPAVASVLCAGAAPLAGPLLTIETWARVVSCEAMALRGLGRAALAGRPEVGPP